MPEIGDPDAANRRTLIGALVGVLQRMTGRPDDHVGEPDLVCAPLDGVSDGHVVPPELLFEGPRATVA
jgi:hypothetical protein